jgi:hypothetical protein
LRIARYDPAYQPNLAALADQYDIITLNYVLNVVPLEAHRAQILLAVRALLKPGGRLLLAVYRKGEQDSKSAAGYQCGWSPEQWEDLIGQWYEGERIPSSAGFLGWVCRPCTLIGRIPGKAVAGRLYFHRSTLRLQEQRVQDAVAAAEQQTSGWVWDVARVDRTAEQVALVKCPDWDTAPEPTVGAMAVVTLGPDSQGPRILDPMGMIYHHKWMFVADDYLGFDVEESKARSVAWEALDPPVDKAKIGRRQYWEERVLPRLEGEPQESGMFGGFE